MPLAEHGLEWIHPPLPVAHPLDDGTAALLDRSLDATIQRFAGDGTRYGKIAAPFVAQWDALMVDLLRPVIHMPKSPFLLASFGLHAARSAISEARRVFHTSPGQALFAGMAAHSTLPLENIGSASFGWVLGLAAHAVGWPLPRGGAQQLANALASYFESLGGHIVVNTRVQSLRELRDASLILLDVSPRQLLTMAGDQLPDRYIRSIESYRHGPAAFKMDWALKAPIPWRSADVARSATVHLGGTLEEIADAERAPWQGNAHKKPFVILVQPSLFDPTRAPTGHHTAWAYCHVPNGSKEDMTAHIESQVERFAPGFGETILARHIFTPADFERYNANFIGGDILGGAQTPRQLVFRPTPSLYQTPIPGVFLCSASTPPGGGVHGMCGYHAAHLALRSLRR